MIACKFELYRTRGAAQSSSPAASGNNAAHLHSEVGFPLSTSREPSPADALTKSPTAESLASLYDASGLVDEPPQWEPEKATVSFQLDEPKDQESEFRPFPLPGTTPQRRLPEVALS